MMKNTLATLLLLATPILCMVGYDCGGRSLNITSLSLLDVGECQVDNIEPQKEEAYIQLLQLSEFDHTHAIQCKIEIDRIIYYCGMHSHVSVVHNGKREYIREISAENCKNCTILEPYFWAITRLSPESKSTLRPHIVSLTQEQ